MNVVVLIGRATRDTEVREAGETKIARYTLAVDRIGKKDEADFINIIAFGKGADFAEQYIKKGIKIAVEGRIRTGSYEKDGQRVYFTEVIADRQEFVESKKKDIDESAPWE